MKKTILLMLVFNSIYGLSQMTIFVVFKPTVNFVLSNPSNPQSYFLSDDAGLNQIFANNNTQFYGADNAGGTSCPIFSTGYGGYIYGNTNLLNELNNYTNAVEIAYPKWLGNQPNVGCKNFYIDLIDPSQGIYVNTINNIVQTNNSDLNAIFQAHNVFSFVQNKIFTCETCDVSNVYAALANLPNIIGYYDVCSEVFLANDNFAKSNSLNVLVKNKTIYIQSDNNDSKSVVVYNILGKQVINTTTSGNPINVAELASGIYIVKVTENGKTNTMKVVIQ